MQKNLLITGSLAFDHIMRFDGRYDENILPDNISNLSVSFLAENHERFFGGCAGNIGYNLSLFSFSPVISGRHGDDFEIYDNHLKNHGVQCLNFEYPDSFTASAYILTDKVNSQIAFFSPSAMSKGNVEEEIAQIEFDKFDLVMVSPDNPERMMGFCRYCIENSMDYVFDPGQGLSILSGEDLLEFAKGAKILIFNDYECDLFCKKTGIGFDMVLRFVPMVVKTLGEGGAEVYFNEKLYSLPAVKNVEPVDITGAGDAFRAGFLYGILNNFSMYKSLAYGNTAASFAIEKLGTQEHFFDETSFLLRLKENYSDLGNYPS